MLPSQLDDSDEGVTIGHSASSQTQNMEVKMFKPTHNLPSILMAVWCLPIRTLEIFNFHKRVPPIGLLRKWVMLIGWRLESWMLYWPLWAISCYPGLSYQLSQWMHHLYGILSVLCLVPNVRNYQGSLRFSRTHLIEMTHFMNSVLLMRLMGLQGTTLTK